MTQAILEYPDWIRTFSNARELLYLILAKAIVANDPSPPIPTGNHPHVNIRAIGNVNNTTLLCEWFLDAALTLFTASDTIDVRAGSFFDQTIPVKGAFLRITAQPKPAGTCTYTLVVYSMPHATVSHSTIATSTLLTLNPQNVGAGATVGPTEISREYAGPAVFTVNHDMLAGEAWNVTLESIDAGGVVRLIRRLNQNSLTDATP